MEICLKIFKDININYKTRNLNLAYNKIYHVSDNTNAKYQHHDLKTYIRYLETLGFTNFTQLNGVESTDFDKPFIKDKYFD